MQLPNKLAGQKQMRQQPLKTPLAAYKLVCMPFPSPDLLEAGSLNVVMGEATACLIFTVRH